mmetsp:Transcript_3853/g.10892  ORF Transcript_3853/g.10892 Transcript_3853/m.10892 type:complete len:246 (-) Transcript_3853:2-739(-)
MLSGRNRNRSGSSTNRAFLLHQSVMFFSRLGLLPLQRRDSICVGARCFLARRRRRRRRHFRRRYFRLFLRRRGAAPTKRPPDRNKARQGHIVPILPILVAVLGEEGAGIGARVELNVSENLHVLTLLAQQELRGRSHDFGPEFQGQLARYEIGYGGDHRRSDGIVVIVVIIARAAAVRRVGRHLKVGVIIDLLVFAYRYYRGVAAATQGHRTVVLRCGAACIRHILCYCFESKGKKWCGDCLQLI